MVVGACPSFQVFRHNRELFAKINKDLVSAHSQKSGLLIIQELSKIKKNPEHAFADIGK